MICSRIALVVAMLAGMCRVGAAINPEGYKRIASDVVKVREIARVTPTEGGTPPTRQRITIVGRVVETVRTSRSATDGDIIVIDYTVDSTALNAAAKAFSKEHGQQPGPQFMYEPDAPTLDAQHEFWAHLARAGGRLANVNRYAGSVVEFRTETFTGPVFVPVAGQYSWDAPSEPSSASPSTAASAPPTSGGESFTGRLKTGIMAIGGETTGVILETPGGTYELDVRSNPAAAQQLSALDGKTVSVTGEYRPRAGVEVKERRIVIVQSLREVK